MSSDYRLADDDDEPRFGPPQEAYENPFASPQSTGEELRGPQAEAPIDNPFLTIWTRPRATIRHVVRTDPTQMVIPLACVAGILQALDRASARSAGDTMPIVAILTVALIAGPLGGLLQLYFAGWAVSKTGEWIGGRASSEEVRAAVAWANVPSIVLLLLWLPKLALFGSEMFTAATPEIDADLKLWMLLMGFIALDITIGIWQIVILLKCIGEVHGFSAWAALGALFLTGLIMLPIIVVIALLAIIAAG